MTHGRMFSVAVDFVADFETDTVAPTDDVEVFIPEGVGHEDSIARLERVIEALRATAPQPRLRGV